jgi:RNase P/RNase MRP subunit p30
MSCPHRELFSCEECIKKSLRENRKPKKPGIFVRYRVAIKERDQLREALKNAREILALMADGEGSDPETYRQMANNGLISIDKVLNNE